MDEKKHRTPDNGGASPDDAIRARFVRLYGEAVEPEAVARSDLRLDGTYGEVLIALMGGELVVVEAGKPARRIELAGLADISCSEYVGNGVLTAETEDDHKIELVRYSRSAAEDLNAFAEKAQDRLTGQERGAAESEADSVGRSGNGREASFYRCSKCGYPLRHATDACPKCASKQKMMVRLLHYLSGQKLIFYSGLFLSLLVTAGNLAPGFLIRLLTDLSLAPTGRPLPDMAERQQYLTWIVLAFFGFVVVRLVAQRYQIRLLGELGERVVRTLRSEIYNALHRLSMSYYDQEHTGRIMARVTSDTRQVQRFIVQGAQQMVTDSLMVVGIVMILFTQDAVLASIALLPIPLVVYVGRKFSQRFRTIYRSVRRRYADLSATVSDSVTGVQVVKAFGQEKREIDTFEERNEECFDAQLNAIHTRARFNPSIVFLMSVGTLIVWFIGGKQVMAGQLSLGVLLQFVTYMNMFRAPVQQLMNLTEVFQQSATAAERIFNVIDKPPAIQDHANAKSIDKLNGHIRLDQVSFGYEKDEKVLDDINLEIRAGEMIGLVGATGSGKSTLAALICRFYDPVEGSVSIDGHDLRDIRLESLRKHIGIVLQDPFLFVGSLRDNIAYGTPGASSENIVEAAKAANAHDFIMELPDAYDTQVGERGVGLSGGEKQRIAIARAILKDPALLILDEATSAVDTATEAMIQDAMDRLVKGRTTIAIAHRLSTLRNADRLAVMEEGRVIEFGTHEELIEKDGLYAMLCRIQADFANEVYNADELLAKAREEAKA